MKADTVKEKAKKSTTNNHENIICTPKTQRYENEEHAGLHDVRNEFEGMKGEHALEDMHTIILFMTHTAVLAKMDRTQKQLENTPNNFYANVSKAEKTPLIPHPRGTVVNDWSLDGTGLAENSSVHKILIVSPDRAEIAIDFTQVFQRNTHNLSLQSCIKLENSWARRSGREKAVPFQEGNNTVTVTKDTDSEVHQSGQLIQEKVEKGFTRKTHQNAKQKKIDGLLDSEMTSGEIEVERILRGTHEEYAFDNAENEMIENEENYVHNPSPSPLRCSVPHKSLRFAQTAQPTVAQNSRKRTPATSKTSGDDSDESSSSPLKNTNRLAASFRRKFPIMTVSPSSHLDSPSSPSLLREVTGKVPVSVALLGHC
jgi:hypothetical protein